MTALHRKVYRYRDLGRLFDPASIAIYGASPTVTSFGTRTLTRLGRDYTGKLYPVNPRHNQIGDMQCFHSISELPSPPDCVVIAVPLEGVEAALLECAGQGVGGAVIYASGYAETGQKDRIALQNRLGAIARESGVRIVGPNCFGYINFARRAIVSFTRGDIELNALQGGASRAGTGIGLISQSGAMGFAQAQGVQRGIGLSHMVATGNACDVDICDVAAYLAEAPECKAVVCMFEGLSDPYRLIEAGEIAWAADKPMIVCKFGSGAQGAAAALSHSGSMAGSIEGYRAVCERAGIIMLDDVESLLDTAAFFAKVPIRPSARGVAVVAISGGAGVFAADKADQHGVALPQPRETLRHDLEALLPEFALPRNPCDVTAMAMRELDIIPASCAAFAADPDYGAVVFPQTSVTATTAAEMASIAEACARHGKPFCAGWLTGWMGGHGAYETQIHPGIALFHSMDRCFAAISHWHRREDRRIALQHEGRRGVRYTPVGTNDKARKLIHEAPHDTLTERMAKQVLAAYGVQVVEERQVSSAAEAAGAARALGYPVVMKIDSPDFPHKTDAGVIVLNLLTDEAVEAAFGTIMANALRANSTARIDGVLVQPAIRAGVESMVGARIDPLFGPLIIVGLGGIFVELIKDSVVGLAPLTHGDARQMLACLRSQALLKGFRGAPAIDLDRVAEVMVSLSEFAEDHKHDIIEFDVNPLICSADDVMAVDALIVRKSSTCPGSEHGL